MTTRFIMQSRITTALTIELLSAPTECRPNLYSLAQRLGLRINKEAITDDQLRLWAKSKMRNNRNRARMHGLAEHITATQWLKLVRYYGGCCRCKTAIAYAGLTIDHIVPLSHGGSNRPFNVQVLCFDCHAAKSFAERNGSYVDYRETLPSWMGDDTNA